MGDQTCSGISLGNSIFQLQRFNGARPTFLMKLGENYSKSNQTYFVTFSFCHLLSWDVKDCSRKCLQATVIIDRDSWEIFTIACEGHLPLYESSKKRLFVLLELPLQSRKSN